MEVKNKEVKDLLLENIEGGIENKKEEFQIKLYMPLKAITYDIENEYGDIKESEYAEEIPNIELIKYEDKILGALEKMNLKSEEQRGLMEYYEALDSVNAKVSKYNLTVEEVNGELMGVAVLTVNENLTENEIELMKKEITAQASDGFGEIFEQREIQAEGRGIYVSFWNNENWDIKTLEQMKIAEEKQIIGGMSI